MKKLLAILVSALMVVMTALPVMATTPFADVPDYHWAVDAVNLLAALGVVEGYPDGTFKGGQPATRYEVALMIARALEYLDKDIRSLAESIGELDAKIGGAPLLPDQKDGVILQPVASPDATILEQVIAEKIAVMSQDQWEQFDERLSALLARVDDLTEDNKAEHAQLWAAIEALRAKVEAPEAVTPATTPVAKEVQEACELLPGCEQLVAEAVAESNAAWQAAVANVEGKIAELAEGQDNLEARLEALRRALFEQAEAAETKNKAISVELAAKLEELALAVEDVPSKADYENAIKSLLAVHAAEEKAARDAAIAALDARIELALSQQKAELMMAFYDSIIAANVDRDILLENLRADFEKALAEREAAILAATEAELAEGQDNLEARLEALRRALFEQAEAAETKNKAISVELAAKLEELALAVEDVPSKADYENAIKSLLAVHAAEEKAARDAAIAALDARIELALSQQKAELMMAFYDSIIAANVDRDILLENLRADFEKALAEREAAILAATEADIAAAIDQNNAMLIAATRESLNVYRDEVDRKFETFGASLDAKLAELEAAFEKALAEQKAELMMAFYDSIAATKDEFDTKLESQKAEIIAAYTATISEMKAAYDARLNDMQATWEVLLAQEKAEIMMSVYDSIAAERDARMQALEEMAAKHELDMAQLRAELQMSFYDSLIAQREDLEAKIDVVVASIGALTDEFDRELKALSARVDTLEAQLALVEAKADQNARDIAETYVKIMTEEIAPISQRVRKLERESEIAKADIEEIKTELYRVRITGSNEVKFIDINGIAGSSGLDPADELYKTPFKPGSSKWTPSSTLQNELKLTLTAQPGPGINVIANIGVLTDIYGVGDTNWGAPKLDLDMAITSPSGMTKIAAGEVAKPANFTEYQIGADPWEDAALEGLSISHDAGRFEVNGFVAKDGHGGGDADDDEYVYIAGAGGRLALTENFSVGARLMVRAHDELSGDLPDAEHNERNELVAGADFELKLGSSWTVTGELSAWQEGWNEDTPAEPYLLARNLAATGKVGVLNIEASHEHVDEDYAPYYLDEDEVEADSRFSKLAVTTDPLFGGLVLNAFVQHEADADINDADGDDIVTIGGGAKYSLGLLGANITLRGDAERETDRMDDPDVVTTTANLGFDVAFKPIEAGFTWKNVFDGVDPDPAMSYIGYAKLNLPLANDTLNVHGEWHQSFGDEQWYHWGAGLSMTMPLIEDKLTLGADAGYEVADDAPDVKAEFNDVARLTLGADLNYKITPATTLSGFASYESRAYEDTVTAHESGYKSGEYLQFGTALTHQFHESTSLTLKYDIKKMLYADTESTNFGVRIIDISLKTSF